MTLTYIIYKYRSVQPCNVQTIIGIAPQQSIYCMHTHIYIIIYIYYIYIYILTVTEHWGILPVVAVVDTPAREATVFNRGLITSALYIVQPYLPSMVEEATVGSSPDGMIKPKHPGVRERDACIYSLVWDIQRVAHQTMQLHKHIPIIRPQET